MLNSSKPRSSSRDSGRRRAPLMSADSRFALNAVCPYFTMFPLEYPMRALRPARVRKLKEPLICDPYCGRGTTIFAARLRGLPVYGVDVAPVAVAIARAKLAVTGTEEVMDLVDELLSECRTVAIPTGAFWGLAFHEETLKVLCRIRRALFSRRTSAPASMLRAIMLGGLHGPRAKTEEGASYFSNQMPRTFSAKPAYAVKFWRRKKLDPQAIDVRAVIRKRLTRALKFHLPLPNTAPADVKCADSRFARAFDRVDGQITHVVTSPPYYGLRTYSQDQWLREWFLGGPSYVDYAAEPGLDHGSPELFARSLARVWDNVGKNAADDIQLYIRFGGIRSRSTSAEDILRDSLSYSTHPWRIITRRAAATAEHGKRQALQMLATDGPIEESDYVVGLAS